MRGLLLSLLLAIGCLEPVFSEVYSLTDNNFEHDTQASTGATTGDWLVFFASASQYPEYFKAGSMPNKVDEAGFLGMSPYSVAVVDTDTSPELVMRMKVKGGSSIGGHTPLIMRNTPALIYFTKGFLHAMPKPHDASLDTILEWSQKGYKSSRRSLVPGSLNAVDYALEWIKSHPINLHAILSDMLGTTLSNKG